MAHHINWKTSRQKEFVKVMQSFSGSKGTWNIWRDFIELFAISLSNLLEENETVKVDREAYYQKLYDSYSKEEQDKLADMVAITVMALKENPNQDFLGELYMGLDFGSDWHGQFFTPWHIAHLMASITYDCTDDVLKDKGYVSYHDPTCGAGVMLLAAAAVYNEHHKGQSYQQDVLFVGQDLDRVVGLMCYIQLSLLGCAGYVSIGNTLTSPLSGHELDPIAGKHSELWFTPMWHSDLWSTRRMLHLISSLMTAVPETETKQTETV